MLEFYRDPSLARFARLFVVQTFLFFSLPGAVNAAEESTQSLLNQKITLNLQNQKLDLFLSQIEQQVKIKFVFSGRLIRSHRRINIEANGEPLSKVLDQVLIPLDLKYKLADELIVLSRKKVDTVGQREQQSVEGGITSNIETDDKAIDLTVKGKVTGEKGEELPGVNVVVKGTGTGTVSDAQGRFSINIKENNSILTFSFIGYLTQEVTVYEQSELNIVLKEDLRKLDEVIVVGYGVQKKSDLTGALASISSKEYKNLPYAQFNQALQGRVAGVSLSQTGGGPNPTFKLRIRGANSIGGNNDPLYIVDGMAVSNMNMINVKDVESIEVLKDASATSIYGSRGANGVVLVTTKKGNKGAPQVHFENYVSRARVFQKIPEMTPYQFALGVNYAEGKPIFNDGRLSELKAGGGEDWFGRIFRPAYNLNSLLSISGASENVNYYISGNYVHSNGILINQDYVRYNLRSNLGVKINDKLRLNLNTSFSNDLTDGAIASIQNALSWDLSTPARKADGKYNFAPIISGVGNGAPNPLLEPENLISKVYGNQLILNGAISYDLFKNMELNISGGYEQMGSNSNSYSPLIVSGVGSASILNSLSQAYQNTNRLTYNYYVGKKIKIKADLVHEQYFKKLKGNGVTASQFFTDAVSYKDLSIAKFQRNTSYEQSQGLQSFLGRFNLVWAEKYLFTASVRADGSTKFQKGNRWGYFPSASIAWRISEESFMKDVRPLNDLKLRLSYGTIGSQAVDPFATRGRATVGILANYPMDGTNFASGIAPPAVAPNKNLTWESTYQGNVGFDLGLFNSRFTLTADAYKKRTKNLLLNRLLPTFAGPTSVVQNVGEVSNTGVEFNLNARIIEKKDWSLSGQITFSRNINKVVKLTSDKPLNGVIAGNFPVTPSLIAPGYALGTFRGYTFIGVYQSNEVEEAKKYGRKPGDAKYLDINGDGLITNDDISVVGSANPNFTYGLNLNLGYKRFQVGLNFIGSQGNDIYNFMYMTMMGLGPAQFHATHLDYANRWTTTNPSNIPAFRDGVQTLSTQFLQNGSYFTLKNLNAGYDMVGLFKSRIIKNLRLGFTAENLFILTKYRGFDPETTSTGNSDVDQGMDFGAYPLSRRFTLGVNITF